MKKIIVSILVIGCLLTTSIVSVNAFDIDEESEEYATGSEPAKVIPYAQVYVDDDNTEGPWDGTYVHPYQFIQDGIDAANKDDTIYVFNGIYKENLVINKSITLRGENNKTTIIDGGAIDDTIWINASYVNIDSFTVRNSIVDMFSGGIKVCEFRGYPTELLTDISISNCIISNNDCGIRMDTIDGFDISNCIINSNSGHSVYMWDSENVTIDKCELYDNGKDLGGGASIVGAIYVSAFHKVSKNIMISNCQIYKNIGAGIVLEYGPGNVEIVEIHHNAINKTGGIRVYMASNIDIHHNTFTNNSDGLRIEYSNNVLVYNNVISENKNNGISIISSSNVTVKHNMISLNKEYGVRLGGDSDNNIIENNFIENKEGAYFVYILKVQNNKWDSNYWDRPRFLPKAINGFIVTMVNEQVIWIPWVEFDWHPAKEPYDI